MAQTKTDRTIVAWLFVGYLLLMLMLPSLAWWRWGLVAALIATVLALGLAGLVFFAMSSNNLLPDLSLPQPPPDSEMARIRSSQADRLAQFLLFAIYPAMAALAGGCLAIACSALNALRRLWMRRAR